MFVLLITQRTQAGGDKGKANNGKGKGEKEGDSEETEDEKELEDDGAFVSISYIFRVMHPTATH